MGLRIVHVITKADYGGAQTVLRELAADQHRRGHAVSVIAGALGPISNELRTVGVDVTHEPALQHAVSLRSDRRALERLVRHLSRARPDIVHTHSSKGGLLGRWAARRLSLPVVYTAHGWPFQAGAPVAQRIASYLGERWSAQYGGPIVCVTDAELRLAQQMRICPNHRLHLIHNGIGSTADRHDERRDAETDLAKDRSDATCLVVMLARFAPPKRHDLVIDAVRDLPWVRVEFAGDGDGRGAAAERAAVLGDRVRFLGRCEPQSVLARADAVVLASDYEGMPMSVLEAMRAARPIIASRLPGVGEVIADGVTGLLADNSVDSFRRCIERLRDANFRAQLGDAARRDWERRFTARVMSDRYQDVYLEAIAERGAPKSSRRT